MTLAEFAEKVQDHDDLEILGATEDDEILVRNRAVVVIHALALESVLSHEWQDLENVLMGRCSGRVMMHLSRIVGYFSLHSNWNRSKLAELRDRGKGDYGISRARLNVGLSTPVELSAEVVEALASEAICKINEKSS